MDRKMRIIKYALIVASVVYTGCFPNKTAKLLDQSAIRQNQQISAPTKIFLHDASVVLFKDGFQVKDDRLEGNGVVCRLNGERSNLKSVNFPMDSVAALTYYETESSAGSVLSSLLLGIYGGFLTPLSVYCLSCPKCCFGSCPTVYSWDGQNYILIVFLNFIRKRI